jgi:hypothetical protein
MNRTSTKAVEGMTPYEATFGKKPDLSEVREWGERVWVRVEGGDKLGGRVREGRWMGLDEKSKGVRIYWPDSRTVGVERNVYVDKTGASAFRLEGEEWDGFNETNSNTPFIPNEPSNISTNLDNAQKSDDPTPIDIPPEIPSDTDETPFEPNARPKRTRKPTERVRELISGQAVSDDRPKLGRKIATGIQLPTKIPQPIEPEPAPVNLEEVEAGNIGMAADFIDEYCMVAEMSESEALEPRDLKEARSRPDWLLWEKAIHEELAVLKAAGTWELVDSPTGANIVGSKWVFRAKKDAAGNVVRYKARLVAQGFSQVPGVDYFDTFAPVARLASIRAVLAMAAVNDYEIHQIDIKGAYLNGKLTSEETIFMKQPPGYAAEGLETKVCHLLKTLYGLKQSGRRWYQCLVEIMKLLGFLQCEVDQAVFYRRKGTALIIVLVHVDDCTIVATKMLLIENFKKAIAKHVKISELRELHWILGIEVRLVLPKFGLVRFLTPFLRTEN